MSELDEIRDRVTRLEGQVAAIRADAAAARVLAGAADRDVSEFRAEMRAHTGTLNALRETQLEQGERLDRVERKVDAVEHKVNEGFAQMSVGMAQITALLTNRIDRPDES